MMGILTEGLRAWNGEGKCNGKAYNEVFQCLDAAREDMAVTVVMKDDGYIDRRIASMERRGKR